MNEEKAEVMIPTVETQVERIERATVDVQIATAHRFPRSMAQFVKRATEMATLDEETAQSCIYRRPVGKDRDGRQTFAEGKSVRMAEIVGASYGNLRVGAIIVSQTDRQVIARGMAHDLESNFAASCEVIEATIKRDGSPYDERMRAVIAKSALAKARRDATFQVVPSALCKSVERAARDVAFGQAKTLAERRAVVVEWIGKLGIDAARVWYALGIAGPDDIGMDQLETLTGLRTALRDGDTTLDEAFPAAQQQQAERPANGEGLLARKRKPAAEAPADDLPFTATEKVAT